MRVAAIVAAGGQGTRLGTTVPKQFLELGGRTVLDRSVEALASCEAIGLIVVALPEADAANPPSYLMRADGRVRVVEGGARRQDSVANAFAAVPGDTDVVVIHDAARPFVDRATIERTIEAAASAGAAIAALPARDTVKLADDDRDGLGGRRVRRAAAGRAADKGARREEDAAARHDLPGADAAGIPARRPGTRHRSRPQRRRGHGRSGAGRADRLTVLLVPGDPRNIKITTTADLAFARGLLLERGEPT